MAEDDPVNRIYMRNLLAKNGFSVDVARDGQEVISILRKNRRYDAILMDVQMPGTSGIQATEAIRRLEKEKKIRSIPIIAVTAFGNGEERSGMFNAGVTDYITKPIKIRDLLTVIARTLGDEAPQQQDEENESPHYEELLLGEFRDSEDTLAEMIRMSLLEFPKRLSKIEEAIAAEDVVVAAENSHSLANVAGILRAGELRDISIRLERLLESRELEEAREVFPEIRRRTESLMDTFRKLLQEKL